MAVPLYLRVPLRGREAMRTAVSVSISEPESVGSEKPKSEAAKIFVPSSRRVTVLSVPEGASLTGVTPVVMVIVAALNGLLPPLFVTFSRSPDVTDLVESINLVDRGGQFSRLDQLAVGRNLSRSVGFNAIAEVSLMEGAPLVGLRLSQFEPPFVEYCQIPRLVSSV